MMKVQVLFVILLVRLSLFLGVTFGSRILLFSADAQSSHYMGSVAIGKALVRRGHHVTVTIFQGKTDDLEDDGRDFPPNMDLLALQSPYSLSTKKRYNDKYVRSILRGCSPDDVLDELPPPDYPEHENVTVFQAIKDVCNAIIGYSTVFKNLRTTKFDMIVVGSESLNLDVERENHALFCGCHGF